MFERSRLAVCDVVTGVIVVGVVFVVVSADGVLFAVIGCMVIVVAVCVVAGVPESKSPTPYRF